MGDTAKQSWYNEFKRTNLVVEASRWKVRRINDFAPEGREEPKVVLNATMRPVRSTNRFRR
jgi:hypothetical protein